MDFVDEIMKKVMMRGRVSHNENAYIGICKQKNETGDLATKQSMTVFVQMLL